MDIKEEILAQMDSALRPEFDKAIDNTIEGAFKEDVKTLGFMVANSIKCQWEVMKPHLFYAYCLGVKAQEAKAQADQKVKLLLCDEHLKKCESPTGIFNSQYPDEEPCLICLAKEAKAQAVPDSPTEKTWDEIHLDPKERLYWSLRSAKKRKSDLNWSHASHQTCVGSTHGRKICEYLGVDPDGKDFVRTQEPAND
ncbi:hypothetical protein [Acinetobacter lwoffii]|uniref:hypothetical protein n=1 Tax=Acinetobacter lwoffii TaxID=28090 RepID=UPI003F922B28